MKKVYFISGEIMFILGILCIILLTTIKKIFPVLGKVASNYSTNNYYSRIDYTVDFGIQIFLSAILILIGIVTMIIGIRSKE